MSQGWEINAFSFLKIGFGSGESQERFFEQSRESEWARKKAWTVTDASQGQIKWGVSVQRATGAKACSVEEVWRREWPSVNTTASTIIKWSHLKKKKSIPLKKVNTSYFSNDGTILPSKEQFGRHGSGLCPSEDTFFQNGCISAEEVEFPTRSHFCEKKEKKKRFLTLKWEAINYEHPVVKRNDYWAALLSILTSLWLNQTSFTPLPSRIALLPPLALTLNTHMHAHTQT